MRSAAAAACQAIAFAVDVRRVALRPAQRIASAIGGIALFPELIRAVVARVDVRLDIFLEIAIAGGRAVIAPAEGNAASFAAVDCAGAGA
jgi:hypothetical protein